MVLIPSLERSQWMDFTIPVGIERYRLLLSYPKEEGRLTAIIRPFKSNVCSIFFKKFNQ